MKFLLWEKIDRARDGRSQSWIVKQFKDAGHKMTDVNFSRKKKGHIEFSKEELEFLSELLNTDLLN